MATRSLDLTQQWPVPNVAASVLRDGQVLDAIGPTDRLFRLASIGKPLVAWACLLGAEEGIISLDDPVGPDDGHRRTIRHLLAHAGGYGFDHGDSIVAPERRRMYGNHGIEVAAEHLATAARMPFAEYLSVGVLEPLGMSSTDLRGSPAYDIWSSVDDYGRFLTEAANPRLISAATAAEATHPQFPGLAGIVPGVGRFDNCPWGLGFEVRGDKAPHWTGTRNSTTMFGHFGGSGTMAWIDPEHAGLSLVALTDLAFDEWADTALEAWPLLSDAVIAEFVGAR